MFHADHLLLCVRVISDIYKLSHIWGVDFFKLPAQTQELAEKLLNKAEEVTSSSKSLATQASNEHRNEGFKRFYLLYSAVLSFRLP